MSGLYPVHQNIKLITVVLSLLLGFQFKVAPLHLMAELCVTWSNSIAYKNTGGFGRIRRYTQDLQYGVPGIHDKKSSLCATDAYIGCERATCTN